MVQNELNLGARRALRRQRADGGRLRLRPVRRISVWPSLPAPPAESGVRTALAQVASRLGGAARGRRLGAEWPSSLLVFLWLSCSNLHVVRTPVELHRRRCWLGLKGAEAVAGAPRCP